MREVTYSGSKIRHSSMSYANERLEKVGMGPKQLGEGLVGGEGGRGGGTCQADVGKEKISGK
jgi:hypothetical protein